MSVSLQNSSTTESNNLYSLYQNEEIQIHCFTKKPFQNFHVCIIFIILNWEVMNKITRVLSKMVFVGILPQLVIMSLPLFHWKLGTWEKENYNDQAWKIYNTEMQNQD